MGHGDHFADTDWVMVVILLILIEWVMVVILLILIEWVMVVILLILIGSWWSFC